VEVRGCLRAWVDAPQIDEAFAAIVDLLARQEGSGPVRVLLSGGRAEWSFVASREAPGLDASVLAHLFDPYLRTHPRDVGRGLALARAVFQAHGGDLVAEFKGTRLILRGGALKAPPAEGAA
jgi:signal transduction histidine kinase